MRHDERPELLDLFCCAGGAAMGYHRAGFKVTGVDINPQPNYPFDFIQGDALDYVVNHYQKYHAIHASPPCQGYSVTKNLHNNSHPDLLPQTRIILQDIGKPYIIENVPGAPMQNFISLDGTMFPELRVIRQRYFESNVLLLQPSRGVKKGYTSGKGKGYSSFDDGYYITVAGHNYRFKDGQRAMGIDWTTQDELSQSIPPIYTEYLGKQLIRYISKYYIY